MTVRDSGGNPFIDFVWGNVPMQPNDDRDTPLDPDLDSHIVASANYEGFPMFIQGAPYDDTITNVLVPDILGVLTGNAYSMVDAVGLGYNVIGTTTVGATAMNDSHVFSQSPSAGTLVNAGDPVFTVIYDYVAPVTHPIAGMSTTFIPAGWSLNSGEVIMYLLGTTVKPSVGNSISITGTTSANHNHTFSVLQVANDNAYNTGGTAVKLTPLQVGVTVSSSTGGTWSLI